MEISNDKPSRKDNSDCPPGDNVAVVPPNELFLLTGAALGGVLFLAIGILIGLRIGKE